MQEIQCKVSNVVLTGGTENMSQSPHVVRNIRWGTRYGVDPKMEDSLAHGLIDRFPHETPMAITAENLAVQYKITREECDTYAFQSQQRYFEGFHTPTLSISNSRVADCSNDTQTFP